MKYNMTVKLRQPETNDEMTLALKAEFSYNEKQYGNGYYLYIKGNNGFENSYDIRYDKDFHSDQKELYLLAWAKLYWSGKDGAYKLVGFSIEEA